jgi:hypothetical protein
MMNTADVTGGKPIAVLFQSISGVSTINPLVAFYEIHGVKRQVLFFYFVPDTTRDIHRYKQSLHYSYSKSEELDGPTVIALGVQSRKLSNIGRSPDE